MNYDNLKFPKQGKKKRKKSKPGKYLCKKQKRSIIDGDEKGICYICGTHINVENHHIFYGSGNRKNSDWYGLTVHLCAQHHKEGRISAHKYREVNYILKLTGNMEAKNRQYILLKVYLEPVRVPGNQYTRPVRRDCTER